MGLRLGTDIIRNVSVTNADEREPIIYNEWVRPSEWIELEDFVAGEEKFLGLYAVEPSNTNNYVTVEALGAYTVDWGDGTVEDYASDVIAYHEYDYDSISADTQFTTSEGLTYRQAKVTVTPQSGSSLTSLRLYHRHSDVTPEHNLQYDVRWLELKVNGPNITECRFGSISTTLRLGFSHCKHVYIGELSPSITTLSYLCHGMQALEKFEIYADTSNVNSFYYMFALCYELEYIPDFDLTRGGNSGGVDTRAMFYVCYKLTRLPSFITNGYRLLSNNPGSMFNGCRSLREIPMFDITPTGLKSFGSVFRECEMVKALPLIDTSTASNLINFAFNCFNLQKIPEYNTSNVTDFSSAFQGCRSIINAPLLDTSSALDLGNMFNSCTALKRAPQLDTSIATIMTGMFNGCASLESVPWMDTLNNERFDFMFSGCYSLRTVPLYDMSSARTVRSMFEFCYSLQDLPDLDTSNIANDPLDTVVFARTFRYCFMLKKIPESFFNGIAGARDIEYIFENCYQLRTIPNTFSNLNTNPSYQVSDYINAFYNCASLRKIPAFAFGSAATSTSNMFGTSTTGAPLLSLESVVINNLNQTTYIRGTMMNREALIALFNGLATVTSKTLDITGCPGAGQIDATDIAIATDKGWTLTL